MGYPEATNYSDDASDFLNDYKKKIVNPRLEEYSHVVSAFSERYDRAYQMINPYYAEAYRDMSFYLGNQWSPSEIEYLNNQRRESLTYNMCMRMINLIEGIQRQNRLSTIISPVESGTDLIAEAATSCIQHINGRSGFYETLSTGFKNSLVTGISWISPYMDYRDDPVNGTIKYNLSHWNDTIWDPFFYNKDLSDCDFFARRKYVSRSEAISMLPEQEEAINQLPYGTRDNKFTYIPYVRQGALNRLLNYTEYWSKKWVNRDVLVDMETGETIEWKGSKERMRMLQYMIPKYQIIKKPVREVNLAIIIENQLMYYGRDPNGLDDYGATPIFSIYEPSYDLYQWKIQSLIRLIRSPQLELNKRRSKMVDILDSQINSGWKAKTGAVTNTDSLFKSGQGPVVFVRPDAQMSDVERLAAADIPQGHFALMDAFEKDIPNILGINPEMLGMPENPNIETAAILSKMRVNAGLISLRRLFDGLAETQQILGKKVMKLIQANWTPEKVALVTKKPCPEGFFSAELLNYDVVVEEGILTDTQRQSQFMGLLALKQMGVEIPNSLIVKNSNLHDKAELNELLDAQAQQQSQIMQQQQDLEMRKLQVVTDGIESKAQSDQALAIERINKVHLDQAISAERIQRAETDKSAAELNMIKAVKELQSMDLEGIAQKIMMIQQLGEIQSMESEQKRAQEQHEMQMNAPQPQQQNVAV